MRIAIAAVLFVAASCTSTGEKSTRAVDELPPMRWDMRKDSAELTRAALLALDTHGTPLTVVVPSDIERWCPAYPEADEADRAAFWSGLLSALAKHESTWNPKAVGGGGRWFGLVQISPGTARGYGCEAKSGQALLDGEKNLSCAIRILSTTVPRDGVVAAGGGGIAADWGPFISSTKRKDMREWVSNQSYCQSG
jgi:hypothetical protein